MSNLQNQVVVHAGLYDQLLNEHAALRAENARLVKRVAELENLVVALAEKEGE